jgi:hypothetical protein
LPVKQYWQVKPGSLTKCTSAWCVYWENHKLFC